MLCLPTTQLIQLTSPTVLNKPLYKHSSPSSAPKSLPSSLSTGFCTASNPIAALLTNAFLDMTASNGTDLRKAGVGPGQHFCVEASAWKGLADNGGKDVPEVKLESSHIAALKSVELDTLKRYAAGQHHESYNGAVRPGENNLIKESGEIGGKEPKA